MRMGIDVATNGWERGGREWRTRISWGLLRWWGRAATGSVRVCGSVAKNSSRGERETTDNEAMSKTIWCGKGWRTWKMPAMMLASSLYSGKPEMSDEGAIRRAGRTCFVESGCTLD